MFVPAGLKVTGESLSELSVHNTYGTVADIETTQRISRRERERLTRRQDIIDAARTVFARKGFGEAKLEDVAELAEFGKGTLYNYFTNKEALFRGVLEDSFERVWNIAEEALRSEEPFTGKVESFVRGELGYFFKSPESLYLMMRESHHLREGNPMMQMMPQLLTLLSESIALEQERKTIITDTEPVHLATILINLLFGQFTSRVFRAMCVVKPGVSAGLDQGVAEFFKARSETEIDEEIASATRLIVTVYFSGITR